MASNGDGSIELEKFETESSDDGIMANLYLNYATFIDYALFNDCLLYTSDAADD